MLNACFCHLKYFSILHFFCANHNIAQFSVPCMFEEEDESHVFDWDRMHELNRRNTLVPAHMQTSYPVETQTNKLEVGIDNLDL